MYRKILDLKKDISTLRKNGSFRNKTCCGLTLLFVKTNIYVCRCSFGNKQIKKILLLFFHIDCSQKDRTQNIPGNVCSFGYGTLNQWAPAKNIPV